MCLDCDFRQALAMGFHNTRRSSLASSWLRRRAVRLESKSLAAVSPYPNRPPPPIPPTSAVVEGFMSRPLLLGSATREKGYVQIKKIFPAPHGRDLTAFAKIAKFSQIWLSSDVKATFIC